MSDKEQRKFPRIPFREICHLEFTLDEEEVIQDFQVVKDLSATGISIESTTEIPVGKKLNLHFGVDREIPVQVQGKVVYSRAMGEDCYVLGIRFLSISHEDQVVLENLLTKDDS